MRSITGLVLISLFSAWVSMAQDCQIIKGAIPLEYCGFPATDLVYQNQVLLPNQAHELYQKLKKETGGTWTLADLDPQENDIWKNTLGQSVNDASDEINIKEKVDSINFASYSITRSENYGFTAEKDGKFYQIYMGTKIHNFLLRKNLLRKLGYTIPGIKYLQNVKVNFSSTVERDNFLLDFQDSVGRDTSRWITSSPEGESYFYTQDLIAMEDQAVIPNLAVGFLSDETIDNKRVFRSLLIPYALTDIPESINMFTWAHGRIFSNNVVMPYEYAQDFDCTNDDAAWMAKRILSLSDKDWEEIVFSAHLPQPVGMLLFEKLKSRRNHLATLFGIPTRQLPVNDQISDERGDLKNGSIEQEFFPGYGRRFKIPDPESPLAFGEMMSVLKARGISEGLSMITSIMNSYFTNNLSEQISTINTDLGKKAQDLLKEGKSLKSLVKGYVLPTINGSLTVSREIIAGSYLGTNNLIQLVDTLGVGINVGAYAGLGGVYAQTGAYVPSLDGAAYMPVTLSSTAALSFNRSYAHVKPITSIKKALKYPFKNVVIPLLKYKVGKKIKTIGDLDFEKINKMAKEEKEKEIQEIYKIFDENLEVGESLIVTDYAGIGLGLDAGMSLYGIADLRAKLGGNTMILSRLHILRKSEKIFQIYKDFGNNNSYEVALGINKFIPIAKIRFKNSKGSAKTKFYSLKLDAQLDNFKTSVIALSNAVKIGSLSELNKVQKPFIIQHQFKETNPQLGLLFLTWNKLNSGDKITVEAPSGDKRDFYRRYSGFSLGLDYESYAHDLISLFQSKLVSSEFSPFNFSSNNIGFSFQGRAVNQVQTFEAEVGKNGLLSNPYISLSRIWNGWRISKNKAKKILDNIKSRYRFSFISDHVLAQTEKFFLYNFAVTLYVHKEGLIVFDALSKEQIKEIFKKHQSRDMTNYPGQDALIGSNFKKLIRYKEKYHKYLAKNDYKRSSKYLIKCIKVIEKRLTTKGYELIFGSSKNFLLSGSIEGFRIGDERGDEAIMTNTLGSVGNNQLRSSTSDIFDFIRQSTGDSITEGEFFINWILGRVI